jgi:hypothetical protein
MSSAQATMGPVFSQATHPVPSFPSARLRSTHGGLPVDVSLIAQLGHGAGNQLFAGVLARLSAHDHFHDELDEPSARIGDTDFSRGDATSLYLFTVGSNGHPFHRHAGHRVFTAVSGSGGTRLRFSTVTDEEMARDASSFIAAMQCVEIPPDCLFTVRFGGNTWHQFTPLHERANHPALFAISCHTNELGGSLPETLKRQVLADDASIPALTELLPPAVADLLGQTTLDRNHVPTVALALDAPDGSLHGALCGAARCAAGYLRGYATRWRRSIGYRSDTGLVVTALAQPPADSLLRWQLNDGPVHYQDTFQVSIVDRRLAQMGSQALLAGLLDAFLQHPPTSVAYLMALRNLAVKPLGLRTSPLGCPVSSLLSTQQGNLFAGRFPVRDQQRDGIDQRCQVVLGANDKHLLFRSCVGIAIAGDRVDITLGTRVRCTNRFGHAYMALVDQVHHRHVGPALLRQAVGQLLRADLSA